jgi:hypothetical protein
MRDVAASQRRDSTGTFKTTVRSRDVPYLGISFSGFGIPLVYHGIPNTIEIPCKYQIPKLIII